MMALNTLNMTAALLVLLRGVIALNHMCPGTGLAIRSAWLLLTASAAGVLLSGAAPTWPDVALHWGIAALVCIDRRGQICEVKS
ncbi:hypothetical protein [Janthinobacterium fluminis]|uniref:Uncharacterized protein n=1 Tax=Janthinobacterium fluminis TaxID=2987524 RepID=A0ABT5JU85_9BURK|nr:hypothetical protein [Janthinobacterium fluminis]MDC8756273.1 hypothetical protein [Janthinobacterium fluminis]